MRRAIVTGADGFLGRHLVPLLAQSGVAVTALTRRPRPQAPFLALGDAPWAPARLADIVEAVMPDIVFHLVGCARGSAAELEQANLGAALSVMQGLRQARCSPLLVCCGSAAEYGRAIVDGVPVCEATVCAPVSVYGTSKLAQTKAVLDFSAQTGTPVLVARIFNPIGPGMPEHLALGDFARQIAALPRQGVLRTGNIGVGRDFIDIMFVADALWTLARNPFARGIVNICSGEPTQLRSLVELLIEVSRKQIVIQSDTPRLRPGEPQVVIGDTGRLRGLGVAAPLASHRRTIERIWDAARTRGAMVQ